MKKAQRLGVFCLWLALAALTSAQDTNSSVIDLQIKSNRTVTTVGKQDGLTEVRINPKDDFVLDYGNLHITKLYMCYSQPDQNTQVSDDGWIYSHSYRWADSDRLNSRQRGLKDGAELIDAADQWYKERPMDYVHFYDEITRVCHFTLQLPSELMALGLRYRFLVKGHFMNCNVTEQDCDMHCDALKIFWNDPDLKAGQLVPFYTVCTTDPEWNYTEQAVIPQKKVFEITTANTVLLRFVRNGDGAVSSGFTVAYFATRYLLTDDDPGCEAGKEFACANGVQCVPMHFICDRIYHCDDLSDETVGCTPMQELVATIFEFGVFKTMTVGIACAAGLVAIILIAIGAALVIKRRNRRRERTGAKYDESPTETVIAEEEAEIEPATVDESGEGLVSKEGELDDPPPEAAQPAEQLEVAAEPETEPATNDTEAAVVNTDSLPVTEADQDPLAHLESEIW